MARYFLPNENTFRGRARCVASYSAGGQSVKRTTESLLRCTTLFQGSRFCKDTEPGAGVGEAMRLSPRATQAVLRPDKPC